MTVRTRRTSAIVLLLAAVWAGRAWAAIRVEVEGSEPVTLQETTRQNTTAWYDAETWLRRLPGTVDWSAEDGRLTYREGGHWAALRAEPPYALRDGLPLVGVDPPRLVDGRLLVSGRFLQENASDFLGRRVRAVPEGPAKRIVLDPGHGGEDPGAGGAQGAKEKDAVLALARTVADRLRTAGFDVFLTRTDDHAIGAAQRAGVANYRRADLFLSLHASGTGRPQARGFELFVSPEPPEGTDRRLWSAGQLGRGAESRRWAERLRASLGEALPSFDRGVSVIPNPVLEAVASPACLLEVGSLAWPPEAQLFSTESGRDTVASAIAHAAEDFFAAEPHSAP